VVTGQSGRRHYRTDKHMKPDSTISLTNAQRILLSGAAEREDGACDLPPRAKGRTAPKYVASLIDQHLVREVRARTGMSVLRDDDAGRPLALVITKRGRDAVRVAASPAGETPNAIPDPDQEATTTAHQPREGSKIATVIRLLSRETGAGLPDLIAATGWLPHTTRAALTGLRKRGYDVTRVRQEEGGTSYRILTASDQAVAA
jgi:Protein of unknown function (DUF3489)